MSFRNGDDSFMKIKAKHIITIIIILGILIRILYIIKTPITERQHDVYGIENQGHLGYIYRIYKTGRLPMTNGIQFYHPPLFHYIAAGWLRVETMIGIGWNDALEGIQVLTLIFSSLIMIVTYKIIEETNFKDTFKILVVAMMAFHPTLILLSGCINNDILTVLLMFLIIWLLIKWHKETNIKNTIFLAITTGLCVMTKISGAIMAIPIMLVFMDRLIKTVIKERENTGKLFLLFAMFGIISLPIGLWHSIRNYILFNQHLGEVLLPASGLYIGNYSFNERFLTVSMKELTALFCTIPGDYNAIAYIIKCSLFGEFIIERINYIGYTLIVLNIVIIILSILAIITKYIKHWKSNNEMLDSIVLSTWIIHIMSYVVLNMNYPYTCTMDFRYLVPTVFCGMYFIALFLDKISDSKKMYYLTLIVEYLLISFNILGITMFLIMK